MNRTHAIIIVVLVCVLLLFFLRATLGPARDTSSIVSRQVPHLQALVRKLEARIEAREKKTSAALQRLGSENLGLRGSEAEQDVVSDPELLSEEEPQPAAEPAPEQPKTSRTDGRKELEPIDTGCYVAKTHEECCAAMDSRYHIHGPPYFGGQACIPSTKGTKYKSGGTCEPESWAQTNDPGNMGSCDPGEANHESLEEVIQKQKLKPKKDQTDSHDLNIMWVTDCQLQLEWSSVLLLWSAFNVGQQGDFTRIATGCETPRMRKWVKDAMETVAAIFNAQDRVKVHFAPKHVTDARDGTNGEVYTPYTKAFGVKHYLDNDKPLNRVGVILDPDFLFMRPFEYRMDRVAPHAVIPAYYTKDWQHDVEPGKPVGQMYGLGTAWKHYELDEICGRDSPCTKVSEQDAWRYFTMGPPIFMTIDDWKKVAQGWYDFLPKIRRKHKDWMEEMRSYTMSAAHHQQKTAIFTHFQISDKSNNPNDEGWPWIDGKDSRLPDICRAGKALNPKNFPEIDPDQDPYPPILHYCQAYEPEYYDKHYFWSKYQINFGIAQEHQGNLLDCDQPFYEDPPRDLLEAQKHDNPRCLSQRRQAWMLCQVQFSLNDMLHDFKKQKCGNNHNKKRTAKHRFDPRPSKVDHPDECRKPRP